MESYLQYSSSLGSNVAFVPTENVSIIALCCLDSKAVG